MDAVTPLARGNLVELMSYEMGWPYGNSRFSVTIKGGPDSKPLRHYK